MLGPDRYFYDNNYKAQLARPSLDVLLQDIYRNRSKLIVVFVGSDYRRKEWCGIELRAIREILLERGYERIMFVRLDDGEVEGVFRTDGYVDARHHSHRRLHTSSNIVLRYSETQEFVTFEEGADPSAATPRPGSEARAPLAPAFSAG